MDEWARSSYGRGMTASSTPIDSHLSHATVADVMHRGVVTCTPEARLADVAATMASHAIHAVVMLPDQRTPLVVSDLDLIRAALAGGTNRTVAEVAREPIATIGPAAPLESALALMAQRDVAHVLVAEAGAGVPAGVLSSFDVASVLAGREPAVSRMIRSAPARPLVSAATLSDTTVGAAMHPGVITCRPDAPLAELAGVMADLHVHCVAVVGTDRRPDGDEHLVWGLVTDMDVLHAAYRREPGTLAGELAATSPLALVERTGLDRAAELMVEHQSTHVVAVAESGQPSGVVSTLDVLRIVAAG